MSTALKLSAAAALLFVISACAQQEEPAPAPVIEPEPVFTGKV